MFTQQIMTGPALSIDLDESLARARRMFKIHGIHHLLVTEQQRLVGLLTQDDLWRQLSPFLNTPSERPQDIATLRRRVHQGMTRQPLTITADTPIREAAQSMWVHGLSCLPVVDEEHRPIGIVTRSDLLLSGCVLGEGDFAAPPPGIGAFAL